MSECKMTRQAYEKAIQEDIDAVNATDMDSISKWHIIDVLRCSTKHYYGKESTESLQAEIASLKAQLAMQVGENEALRKMLDDCKLMMKQSVRVHPMEELQESHRHVTGIAEDGCLISISQINGKWWLTPYTEVQFIGWIDRREVKDEQ